MSMKRLSSFNKEVCRYHSHIQRKQLEPYINFTTQYYDSGVTLQANAYEQFDAEGYFNHISQIWKNRDITVICGETVFNTIEYNIFDCATSVSYIYAPSINAFEEYEGILEKCTSIPLHHLVIIILGPTATVLAYDLAKKGYQALDFGHVAKAFDWYKKNKTAITEEGALEFYSPD